MLIAEAKNQKREDLETSKVRRFETKQQAPNLPK